MRKTGRACAAGQSTNPLLQIYGPAVPAVVSISDGHCLTEQVLGVCHLQESTHLDDLRAASLEALIQLVSAGFGCTLVPALSLRSSWTSGSGVVLRTGGRSCLLPSRHRKRGRKRVASPFREGLTDRSFVEQHTEGL